MLNDGRVAGLLALAIFVALTVFLAVAASRPPPVLGGARAPPLDTTEPAPPPLVCVSPQVICRAPQLPAGYPCTCPHPLRGTVRGWVAPADGTDLADLLDRLPAPTRPFDWDELIAP